MESIKYAIQQLIKQTCMASAARRQIICGFFICPPSCPISKYATGGYSIPA